jgi:hypothetical protein
VLNIVVACRRNNVFPISPLILLLKQRTLDKQGYKHEIFFEINNKIKWTQLKFRTLSKRQLLPHLLLFNNNNHRRHQLLYQLSLKLQLELEWLRGILRPQLESSCTLRPRRRSQLRLMETKMD